jgi:tetratricopeptide (TPR) repeat protein
VLVVDDLHAVAADPKVARWLNALQSNLESRLAAGGSIAVSHEPNDAEFLLEGGLVTENSPHTLALRLVSGDGRKVLWSTVHSQSGTLDSMSREVVELTAREVFRRLVADESQRITATQSLPRQLIRRYDVAVEALEDGETDRALTILRELVDIQPDFALAQGTLARTLMHRGWFSLEAKPDFVPRARMAALHALNLDDSLAEPYLVLANLKGFHDWNWAAAEELYQQAIQRNPSYAPSYVDYAGYLIVRGRSSEAMQAIRTADLLAPSSAATQGMIGNLLYYLGEYAQAHIHLDNALAVKPDHSFHAGVKACSYIFSNELDAANQFLARAETLQPNDATLKIVRAMLLLEQHQTDSGRAVLGQVDLDQLSSMGTLMSISVLLAMRETEDAFARFEQAYRQRLIAMPFAMVHPAFNIVKQDERYQSIMAKMNLARF